MLSLRKFSHHSISSFFKILTFWNHTDAAPTFIPSLKSPPRFVGKSAVATKHRASYNYPRKTQGGPVAQRDDGTISIFVSPWGHPCRRFIWRM